MTTAADRLLLLHMLIIILTVLFFLFTLGISILLTMIFFVSYMSEVYVANSMWIALLPPSILTIIFLQKILSRLYDRLYVYVR